MKALLPIPNSPIPRECQNVIRVQESFVSQKRSPWIIAVLVLAVLAFVGISMMPLLGSVFQESSPSVGATPTLTPTLSSDEKTKLEAEAKGYELVLQREPQNPTALRGLLEARLKLRDIQGTIAPLEQLVKLNPDEADYAVLLAQAKQYVGDREGAAQTYRTILSSKPGNLKALQGLVSLFMQQGRPEAAVGVLQDTLKTATQVNDIQPGTVDIISVQLLLGQVYASQQRFTEAIAIYDESIKANQQDFRPVLAKALILKEQGKTADAKPLFSTAASLAPAQYKDQIKQLESDQPTPTSSPQQNIPAPTSSPTQTTPTPTTSPSPEKSNFPEPLPSASP